ncbi:Beta-lactamase [Hyphomicrobium sp. 1Nfss2.1]|uniref:class A beta-lactamase n=1 Tax=Hyphomicrobium sp. 1Nfss2.1 TaxID=3413936 RepID=UPI003C7EB32C
MPAISRREVLGAALAIAAAQVTTSPANAAPSDIDAKLAEIEAGIKGKLGVAIIDTKTGELYARNPFERFPLCSTFKLLAAALVLVRVDNGEEKLDRRIVIEKGDIVPYSPVTEQHIGGEGMTIAELCEAAITRSDNTAANVLLKTFGGPEALTNWLRTLGDQATRLDRAEPALNDVSEGDFRDGTTPRAMAYTVQRILLGNVLSKSNEKQLLDWLVANKTGDARLRAGLPSDWRVGDKTGTCKGTTSDVAIVWPPNHPPLIIAAYLTAPGASPEAREKALASVARTVTELV